MQSTMMNVPLSLNHLLERAGTLFPSTELVSRRPDKFITGSRHEVPVTEDKFTDDGWLRKGDVASVDALGIVKIRDRTKDLIKSGGEWISSVDLENALMAHPAVAEAAKWQLPERYETIDAVPRTATGMLWKLKLRERVPS